MNKLFEIATSVSTPLEISGFFAAIVFLIYRQALARLHSAVGRVEAAQGEILIVNRLFILALVAMGLDFAARLIAAFLAPTFFFRGPQAPTREG